MRALCVVVGLLLTLVCGAAATFECVRLTVDSIAPNDPRFSPNACVVISDFTVINCSIVENLLYVDNTSTTADDLPCPGYGVQEVAPIVDGSQIIYGRIEDAIRYCPFTPALIEFIGTLYVTNVSQLVYNRSADLIIRGVSQTTYVPPQNVTGLVAVNVTYFNETLNATVTEEQLQEQVISTTPEQFITLQSTIVGLQDVQVLYQNVSVKFENFVMEGCGTERGVFLTLACPESCSKDQIEYCPGGWFPKDLNVTDNGFCQQSGAFFNGSQSVYVAPLVNSPLGDQSSQQFQLSEFTLEAWINPSSSKQQEFAGIAGMYARSRLSYGNTGYGIVYGGDFGLRNDPGSKTINVGFRVTRFNNVDIVCNAPIAEDQWAHIAGTWGPDGMSMYVNGILYCNRSFANNAPNYNRQRLWRVGAAPINMGESDEQLVYFSGILDEVRLWNYVRTSAQIQFTYQNTLSPLTAGLVLYFKFDLDPNFSNNLAPLTTTPTWVDNSPPNNDGELIAVYDCFCVTPEAGCAPSLLFFETPLEAVEEITNTDSIDNYEFIRGTLISPNGDFGSLWLPGGYIATGPIFNVTLYFVAGRYEEVNSTEVCVYNQTTNTTYLVTSNATQEFVPGTNPSVLPPALTGTWAAYDFFMPGWFANDGKAPFWSGNFFPGRFVYPGVNATLPDCYKPCDKIFEPGILYPDGTWAPFIAPDPFYVIPISILGGFCFRGDIDECDVPPLDIVIVVPPPISDLEDQLGCAVTGIDYAPSFLNPTQRDPCFVLRSLREALGGADTIDPVILGECNFGPNDPEPVYLDPTRRDPCFVARDLIALIPNNTLNCSNGLPPSPPIYMPCLKNQDLIVIDMMVQNYYGDKVLCQHACDEKVDLVVIDSGFMYTPGSAIWSSGLDNMDVHGNSFCPCGGKTEACVYLNANHISSGQFMIYNNRHCAVEDILPYTCEYPLTPELRCVNGQLMCLDIDATLNENCVQVEVTSGVFFFDTDCAVYSPCECAPDVQSIILPDGTNLTITENTGNFIVELPFLTPLLSDITGGASTMNLTCSTSVVNRTFSYGCFVNTTVEMTIGNVTMNITILVPSNCSVVLPVTVGGLDALSCECPQGFNASFTSNLTGAAAAQALGLYDTCQWDIPGGQPGEYCLDGVVQCPYLGGTLGSGDPPPVPLGVCDGGTAVLDCANCASGIQYYEGKNYTCPPVCSSNGTLPLLFTVACDCNDFALVVTCERDISCIPPIPCANFTNVTLCAYTGTLTFDGVPYPCAVLENATGCVGISYAASDPTPPPDGFLRLPCDNSYIVPGPGPCSCSSDIVSSNNITVQCNTTLDPNCTASTPSSINTGDPSLQLYCVGGRLTCRCDGIQAVGPGNYSNFTLFNNSAAFWIDHIPLNASLWFQQNNVAQQLPIGWRYTRFKWDLIENFPLNVLHWFSGHGVMHESARLSPYISGTVYDWADGYESQWNFRTCNSLDPGPNEGVYNNECKQYRPSQNTSCVVDSEYNQRITPDFMITRFDRIKDAIATESCRTIIIHKSVNPYQERMKIARSNLWIGSYDNAVIVATGHGIYANDITLRGIAMVHTNANDFPLVQPTPVANDVFDTTFDGPEGAEPPARFSILNCHLLGSNVEKAGAIVGRFGDSFVFKFNTLEKFNTRAVHIACDYVMAELNTFIQCRGRAWRLISAYSYIFQENLFINCVGMPSVKNVEIVAFKGQGDLGPIVSRDIGTLVFQNFSAEEYSEAFDIDTALAGLNPNGLACNAYLDPNAQCYIRGNIIVFTDEETRKDRSTICFRIFGGNITADRVIDNKCTHAKIGMDFAYTPSINFLNAAEIFATNALVRVRDTFRSDPVNSADFCYRAVGSRVSVCCYFPNCWANLTYPTMEVNPRHDLIISPRYGFLYMQNLTDAARFAYPLNLINVTSGRAILRREKLALTYDIYAVGWPDPFCCQCPIIYGSAHQLATPICVFDCFEFRFEVNITSIDDAPQKMFETPAQFYVDDLHFYNVKFNGMDVIAGGVVAIAKIHVEPATGMFVMENCDVYNWWHYPIDAKRGIITSSKAPVPVIISENEQTFYYMNRAPNIDGFYIFFQKNSIFDDSQFVPGSRRNPAFLVMSSAVIKNNRFQDLDGNVITLAQPGNWEITDNVVYNCGMRQPRSTSAFALDGNARSTGTYIIESNHFANYKNYLFPIGGGAVNRERYAAMSISGILFASVFIIRNNTVVRNGPTVDFPLIVKDDQSAWPWDNELPGVKYGWFETAGPKFFNAPYVRAQNPDPNTWDPVEIADRDVNPDNIISGGMADIKALEDDEANNFNDPEQRLVSLRAENKIYVFQFSDNTTGFTVGVRFRIPPQVIIKTLNPDTPNATYFSFDQDQLYPYRIVSVENGYDAMFVLSWGNISKPPSNGPGIRGISDDIISCPGYKDALEKSFSQCIVCNSGCPIDLPETCIVDPQNATFVPENPYYNKWLFSNMQSALLNCRDIRKTIVVARQRTPYTDWWHLDISGYTIISYDRAQIAVSMPVTIAANDLRIYGFEFLHRAGNSAPTMTASTAILGVPPSNITIQNCSFYGDDTTQSAIIGNYASLALLDNRFQEYKTSTDSVVSLESNCGMLFMENNTFFNVLYSAVTAIEYDIITMHMNKFRDCGSKATNALPYCVYVQSCFNTTTRITFTNNKHVAKDYVYVPGSVRKAAYWIDGLPFARRTAKINLDFNAAEGLDIGMRITNVDEVQGGLSANTRDTVAQVSVFSKNQDVTGLWHYVVWGFPSQDAAIDADPAGTQSRYCDADCGGGSGDASLVIFIFSVIGLVLLCSLFVIVCQCRSPAKMHSGYSETLGVVVPTTYGAVPQ